MEAGKELLVTVQLRDRFGNVTQEAGPSPPYTEAGPITRLRDAGTMHSNLQTTSISNEPRSLRAVRSVCTG